MHNNVFWKCHIMYAYWYMSGKKGHGMLHNLKVK